MIILNIAIAFIGLISIFLTRKINLEQLDLGFKRHFIILALKMAFYFLPILEVVQKAGMDNVMGIILN